ncbi:hypothetical protein KAU92_01975 [Candidatus Bathyarchaeota archaeon]|nr:hypothetical protein [Candidatus Bathyarchaeota archaeon]
MQKYYEPRISKSGKFKLKGKKVIMACKVTTKEYDRVSRLWRITEQHHEDIPVEELGFQKEILGFVLFMREAVSTRTLLTMKAYFRQDVRIAIPKNRRTLTYSYLYVTPPSPTRSLNPLMIRHFAHNATTTLSMGDIEENEITFQRIGKPKRISEATKDNLMQKKEFLGLFRTEKLNQLYLKV